MSAKADDIADVREPGSTASARMRTPHRRAAPQVRDLRVQRGLRDAARLAVGRRHMGLALRFGLRIIQTFTIVVLSSVSACRSADLDSIVDVPPRDESRPLPHYELGEKVLASFHVRRANEAIEDGGWTRSEATVPMRPSRMYADVIELLERHLAQWQRAELIGEDAAVWVDIACIPSVNIRWTFLNLLTLGLSRLMGAPILTCTMTSTVSLRVTSPDGGVVAVTASEVGEAAAALYWGYTLSEDPNAELYDSDATRVAAFLSVDRTLRSVAAELAEAVR